MNERATQHERQILPALGTVLRRRRVLLAVCLLGVLAPVLYYNETTSPLYEASASLVFEELGNSIFTDVYRNFSTELFLFNSIEEINSRAFAEDIAKALPPGLKDRLSLPEKKPGNFDAMQHIIDAIHKSISAYPLRNSNIVKIQVQMSDPRLCAAVAELCLRVLQERNSRIRHEGVTDLRRFIDEQLGRFSAQLREADSNLLRFKEVNNITSLDSESNEILRKMTEAEVLYNTTRANRDAAQERLAAVEQTLAARRRELVPAVTNIASPSAQRLKEKLIALQAQYAQLVVQHYPADHPELVRLQQEIEQTTSALSDEVVKLAKGGSVGDPLAQFERYLDESVSLQIEIESLKARERALNQTVEGYRRVLNALPAKEVELARHVRERDVNQRIYTSLLEKREEVRISEAKQIPNSRVIDRPQVPEDPIKPRKGLNLTLGTVFGLILGMGLGLLVESGASRLGSTLEFEKETGWPVLALVPLMEGRHRPRPERGRSRSARPSLLNTEVGQAWRKWRDQGRSEADFKKALHSHLDPDSAAGESYFMLRTRLELMGIGAKYRSLLVTSTAPRDGKSSTLSNLAATFGAGGRTAVVVDAELRRPIMHSIFDVRKMPGLTDLLLTRIAEGTPHRAEAATATPGPAERKGCLDPTVRFMLQATEVDGVTVLASGKRVREAQWEMARAQLPALLAELEKAYDVVLVDSASPILVHDTLILCGMVDAVVVVVDAQAYNANRLMGTKHLLERAGANVVGAVLNKVDPGGEYSYYYSHYYSHRDT